jgi:YHS domain-containing protein
MRNRNLVTGVLLVSATILCASSSGVIAGPQFVVALQGYDAVSYFEEGKPVKGDFMHSVHWNGATWLFANEGSQQLFRKNPSRYAPQFDGYCALAASLGYKAPGDALAWKIVDGKLFLNFNAEAARVWNQDVPGNIRKGEANWPKLNPL